MARRSSPRRRLAGLALGLFALLSSGTVLGAELPPDVVTDGTVTITVSDPAAAGAPLDAMTVTLTALRADLGADPIIQQLAGPTDGNGVVVFTGVARPADGAPPVSLAVEAVAEQPNTCGGTDRWTGEATGVGGLVVDIDLAITSGTSSCAGRTIGGRVVDAAGDPFPVASAEARIEVDGSDVEVRPVPVDANGDFVIVLDGSPGMATTVTLLVLGEVATVSGPGPDCERKVMEVAEAAWDLPPMAPPPEPVTVVSEQVVLTEVCGSSGTPGPDAPGVTLPPTDAGPAGSGSADAGSTGAAGALMIVAGLAMLAAGGVVWRRRRTVACD
jgi:LPXTG-motif cell wall-anchored protein